MYDKYWWVNLAAVTSGFESNIITMIVIEGKQKRIQMYVKMKLHFDDIHFYIDLGRFPR